MINSAKIATLALLVGFAVYLAAFRDGGDDTSLSIAIVTHSTADVDYYELTKPNHADYAARHGYTYWPRTGRISGTQFFDPNAKKRVWRLGLYWQKIAAMEQALEREYDWVMWVDADVVFTNPNVKIESIIERYGNDKDLIVATDLWLGRHDQINSGVFLVRNSPGGRKLIADIASLYTKYKNRRTPEQQALQDTILNENGLVENAVIVPQRAINAFYDVAKIAPKNANWHACDFAAHVCATPDKRGKIEQLLSRLDRQEFECSDMVLPAPIKYVATPKPTTNKVKDAASTLPKVEGNTLPNVDGSLKGQTALSAPTMSPDKQAIVTL